MAAGFRALLGVPMLRDGRAIGAITVGRAEPGTFSDPQVKLLSTFAEQAVIAIENVRLFKELEVRNRDLTETLEQQTATGEILRVISSSPTDVQPVFDAVVPNAVRLCGALHSAAVRLEGGLLHLVSHHNWSPEGLATVHRLFPMPVTRDHVTAHAVREARTIHLHHMQDDPTVAASSRELAIAQGYQTLLVVPMLRDRQAIGAIIVAKVEGPFSESQVALLKTFADQAVIAIENVRLFTRAGGAQPRPDRDPRAADRHRRDPAGHLELADRRAAGLRHHRGERPTPLRGGAVSGLPVRQRGPALRGVRGANPRGPRRRAPRVPETGRSGHRRRARDPDRQRGPDPRRPHRPRVRAPRGGPRR